MTKVKIGIFCEGMLGDKYLKAAFPMEQYHYTGYHAVAGPSLSPEIKIPFVGDAEALIDQSDALLIITDPAHQFEIAKKCIKKLKHVFIEKPVSINLEKVEILLSMQREANVKIQVGSGIRSNKEFVALSKKALKPLYIETRNFSAGPYNSDTMPVVLNLMLEDIDIALSLVKSEVQKINAIGVCVVNNTHDIVNARLEFGNGCVVTLTAGRISPMEIHNTSLFLKDNSITLDFLEMEFPDQPHSSNKSALQHQATETAGASRTRKEQTSIHNELLSFYDYITKNTSPYATLYDAHKALKLAYQLIGKIDERVGEQ